MLKLQDLQLFGVKLNKNEQFSPTWSCVSLPRPTTLGGWKLLKFIEFQTNHLQIVMFQQTFRLQ